jgi:hypothetical protein
MSDPFGITDGVKTLTSSINESVKASQELSEAIEGVLELADKAAKDRADARKKARQVNPDTTTIIEAVDEWQRLLIAKQSETKIQQQITKKYGTKAWDEIQAIKARKLWEERQDKLIYQVERRKARSIMALCWIAAVWFAYECTWGQWR